MFEVFSISQVDPFRNGVYRVGLCEKRKYCRAGVLEKEFLKMLQAKF